MPISITANRRAARGGQQEGYSVKSASPIFKIIPYFNPFPKTIKVNVAETNKQKLLMKRTYSVTSPKTLFSTNKKRPKSPAALRSGNRLVLFGVD